MKQKSVIVIVYEILLEMARMFAKEIKEGMGKIVLMLQILFPVWIAWRLQSVVGMICYSCLFMVLVTFLSRFAKRWNHKEGDGFPVPPCPLIKENEYGMVEIVPGREEVAIVYLAELEEYLKIKGIHIDGSVQDM